jgi:hypothetical protein
MLETELSELNNVIDNTFNLTVISEAQNAVIRTKMTVYNRYIHTALKFLETDDSSVKLQERVNDMQRINEKLRILVVSLQTDRENTTEPNVLQMTENLNLECSIRESYIENMHTILTKSFEIVECRINDPTF